MTNIINILGSPGVGKSVLAAELFSIFKKNGYTTEIITEFAKDLVYKGGINCIQNQVYVSGIQHHKIWTILKYYQDNNIENGIVITDSPLILGLLYKNQNQNPFFDKFILNEFQNYYPFKIKNNNYLLNNFFENFEKTGRIHNKNDSINLYEKLKNLLEEYDISYYENNYEQILNNIIKKFNLKI